MTGLRILPNISLIFLELKMKNENLVAIILKLLRPLDRRRFMGEIVKTLEMWVCFFFLTYSISPFS